MNIAQAKQEIENTVKAYTAKKADGTYRISPIHQRPVLLIGPPGIGKTAIMEQIALNCNVGLVSYTITHHTRQSAVGLPLIEKREFQGKEYTVTEYTMSEIVASVYECMESTGLTEGILFIDEINCVSETLAPTMLQFLQCKTFGNHRIPHGWVIVAAGNPPKYNKSVREFDIVTLDRVKKIEVEEDYPVWKTYARKSRIHPYILAYLDLKKENFYRIEANAEGHAFVTARGWEDLSQIMETYEEMGLEITAELICQYLQYPDVAKDFACFYDLCVKYEEDYDWTGLLSKEQEDENECVRASRLKSAGFDEKIVVLSLLVSGLHGEFFVYQKEKRKVESLYEALLHVKGEIEDCSENEIYRHLEHLIKERKKAHKVKKESGLSTEAESDTEQWITDWILRCLYDCKEKYASDGEAAAAVLRSRFEKEKKSLLEKTEEKKKTLERAVGFVENTLSQGQETAVFIKELSADEVIAEFIAENGCSAFERVSKIMMAGQRERELKEEIQMLSQRLQS